MRDIRSKIKKEIIRIFRKHISNDFLLIAFGSFAKEKDTRTSDIDLALYADKPLPTDIILDIKEELNTKAHTLRDIDLINLTEKYLDTALLENVLEGGKIWNRAKNSKELLKNLRRRLTNTKR